ncbi:xanthine dehydrogenase family protein molybdopterin-binding subunit [Eoetvoesiella caeni]|uniref:CO/xanthine dehydrogenase Mo-binding subunit n=1 Tax=Eoetvoesiella caeni TaxID=645616 RepID=A0A366H9B8_9BURK|nr:molybdopterin cofactor-binding domain-containing protein [Eoetvoesiella caeni]MCI2809475.1 molybdopterin-dependent oxidoreductase [Eoetvoesiella caeni]NYT55971.1 xanthine dehydrogenase family protein molybdopterin-binding subunit [Eoetvoesiella caeni]RBP38734.1 CO/xanthine dehydrogenase Mo-binding subunit [Eoetvoesiella caeni]
MSRTSLSRRRFLQASSLAGITVYIAPFGSTAYAALFDQRVLTPVRWDPATGKAQFRVDGIAKVSGAKVFARDIRARDLPNWPEQQSHALILRAARADAVYQGFDLTRLGQDLKPDKIVTAAELQRDGIAFTEFYGDDMLLPTGKTPAYLGHAVAILIFHDFARFRLAKDALQFQTDVIKYGNQTGPLQRDPWGNFRYVRVGGKDGYAEDVFSSLKDAPIFPSQMRKHLPVWPDGKNHGDIGQEGMHFAQQIQHELDNPPEGWLVLKRKFTSQSTDTAALEPDNANCWHDAATQTMHLVVPTQSPSEVAATAAAMLAKTHFNVKTLVMHPCYTVGYGSKDHCNMPFYGMVCALYSDGKPVRIANDRYEQFQTSLKRHAFDMDYTIAVDRKSGLIQCCAAQFVANGGGRSNFSPSVAMVAATAAQSIYYLPKSDFTARADATRAIDAGSARGYGTLQSMAATEMLVDELAHELGLDPIEFRLRNVLKTGMKNTQGAIPAGAVRADEVLQRAQQHPVWRDREKRKAEFEARDPARLYGVGFACVQKDFGTGAESSLAKVELSPEGKVLLRHSGTEIGTGMSTSQALACARWLGEPATDLGFAITDWPDLPMTSSGDPYLMSQEDQDKLSADPTWTPAYASPASASNSAFYYTHTTREACRIIFDHGLWPAAVAIWSHGIGGGQAAPYSLRREDARWENGLLTANGMQGLSLKQLAAKAHEIGAVVGAAVHGFNRWQWTEADFNIKGTQVRLPLDGLALCFGSPSSGTPGQMPSRPGAAGSAATPNTRQYTGDHDENGGHGPDAGGNAETGSNAKPDGSAGTAPNSAASSNKPGVATIDAGANTKLGTTRKSMGRYQFTPRSAVYYPPVQRNNAAVTYYSAMATLAEVAVHRDNGQVQLLNHHSVLECGTLISPELVSGQIQGGIAMGIGHALYEHLPLYEDGPGDGTWNFNRFHVPLAKEVALWTQTAEILPPLSETDPPKGMAEVAMIPIVAAIVNGITHATGHRFRSLPVTAETIQEALA